MKKIVSSILIILITSLILINTNFTYADTGKITVDTLNIRKEPNTTSNIVAQVAKGQTLNIIEDNGEWLKVSYGSYTGYVKSQFVSKDNVSQKVEDNSSENKSNSNSTNTSSNSNLQNTSKSENSAASSTDFVSNCDASLAEDVTVYSLPALNSMIVGNLKKDSQILIINSAGQWAYIQTDSISGWIKLSATNIVNDTSTENTNTESDENTNNDTSNTEKNSVIEDNQSSVENTTQSENTNSSDTKDASANTNSYPKTMYANKEGVRIRASASTDSEAINSLRFNEGVTVKGEEGDWYIVTYQGDTRYVKKGLLSNSKK